VIKYWVCKAAPGFVYEAMECLGGNGYVEEGVLARLYREAPVNAIWEGSGNVVCLDLLRALMRDGDAAMAVLTEVARATAALPGCAEAIAFVTKTLAGAGAEAHARSAVESLALLCAVEALQASAPAVAEVFARARLAHHFGRTYGAVDLSADDSSRLLERALPSA
jgi:putative acyl-CoA dehydrogenase